MIKEISACIGQRLMSANIPSLSEAPRGTHDDRAGREPHPEPLVIVPATS